MHLKKQLKLTISGLFPISMTKYRYKRTHGTKINLSAPTTFDEKLGSIIKVGGKESVGLICTQNPGHIFMN